MGERVTVYGADWCGDTGRRTLRDLDRAGVGYDYVDIEEDRDAEKKVMSSTAGNVAFR